MHSDRCPPVNILLDPEQAETDEIREKMAEHLKTCSDCKKLVKLAGGQRQPAPEVEVPSHVLDKLLREVAHVIVHLYRAGYPKCHMVKHSEDLALLIFDMLRHQPAVVDSMKSVFELPKEELHNLWLQTTRHALMVLVVASRMPEIVDTPHLSWADYEEDFRLLVARFAGPCQNRPAAPTEKRKEKKKSCGSRRRLAN